MGVGEAELSLETTLGKKHNSRSSSRHFFPRRICFDIKPWILQRLWACIFHTSQVTTQGQDLEFLCRDLSCNFVFCQRVCGLGLVAAYSCVQIHSCVRRALQAMHGFSFTLTVTRVSSIDPSVLFFEAWRSKKRLIHPCCG